MDNEIISDTLTAAFEGGSNSWYQIVGKIEPEQWTFESEPKRGEGRHWFQDYPINGGALTIIDFNEDEKEFSLNPDALERGLQVMQDKYPKHYTDMMEENGDATTGDVFLQCCLFGDIIYG